MGFKVERRVTKLKWQIGRQLSAFLLWVLFWMKCGLWNVFKVKIEDKKSFKTFFPAGAMAISAAPKYPPTLDTSYLVPGCRWMWRRINRWSPGSTETSGTEIALHPFFPAPVRTKSAQLKKVAHKLSVRAGVRAEGEIRPVGERGVAPPLHWEHMRAGPPAQRTQPQFCEKMNRITWSDSIVIHSSEPNCDTWVIHFWELNKNKKINPPAFSEKKLYKRRKNKHFYGKLTRNYL